jgi:large subunit ribosomal protein L11
VIAQVKAQIPAGKANPAPPVGPALGPHGVNIMEFCKAVQCTRLRIWAIRFACCFDMYNDRSFTFILKDTSCFRVDKKAAGVS